MQVSQKHKKKKKILLDSSVAKFDFFPAQWII